MKHYKTEPHDLLKEPMIYSVKGTDSIPVGIYHYFFFHIYFLSNGKFGGNFEHAHCSKTASSKEKSHVHYKRNMLVSQYPCDVDEYQDQQSTSYESKLA